MRERQLDFEDLLVRKAMEQKVATEQLANPPPRKGSRLLNALKNLGRRRTISVPERD